MHSSHFKKEHFKKLEQYGINHMILDTGLCLKYKAGETILHEGMPILYLFIVVKGKAKVCAIAKNGKDLVLCYYISHGLIGDIELMTNASHASSSVIAVTDFECIALPYKNYAADLKNNLTFLNRLGSELSVKLIRSSKDYVSTALCTGEERLCSYILESSNNQVFNEVLADESSSIGMSYRHMFRLLNQLCMDGILDKKDYGYLIIDRHELIRRSADSF